VRRSGPWPFALPGASGPAKNARIGEAAWIARCVGRGTTAPMTTEDVVALAESLNSVDLRPGGLLFGADDPSSAGVWIVREGRVELSVGSGRRRVVVGVLRAGDVEGDIPLLLGRSLPAQLAGLLLDEAESGDVLLPQRTDARPHRPMPTGAVTAT